VLITRRVPVLCILLTLYVSSARSLPTQTFLVSATIVAGCAVSGTNTGVFGTLDFGTHSGVSSTSVSASYVQSTTIILACTPGTTLNMSINGGIHASSNTRHLKIANFSDQITYRLFTNSSHSAASEIPINQNVAVTYSDSNNITLPIYGLLQLSGVKRAGNYSDTLTVTLSW